MPSQNSPQLKVPSPPTCFEDRLVATNNFDTISKRSVERHYRPQEAQLQRHFVKKPQRRSPLLNRVYWIRLKAVEHVVGTFINDDEPQRTKIVINLGCGSDVLPWRMHSQYKAARDNTQFIDVDFPSLMRSKRRIVTETPSLRTLLGDDYHTSNSESDHLLLSSKAYCQVGCDLTDVATLRDVVSSFVERNSHVLVVAEMSLMYNNTNSMNSLLDWAKNDLHAEFCLLEHCLPAGERHPFANRLLRDHDKSQTPLTSLRSYPDTRDQRARFQQRGWTNVQTWNLWEVWTNDAFINVASREKMKSIEPFDDWEDLILLCRHFFVLHASTGSWPTKHQGDIDLHNVGENLRVTQYQIPKAPKRKFGGALQGITAEGRDYLLNIMGFGLNDLSETYDVFSLLTGDTAIKAPVSGPAPRACFTLSDLCAGKTILVGGRSLSVDAPSSDCWLFSKESRPHWTKTWDLPQGLYRHSAVRLGQSSMVLVMGGQTAQETSQHCFFFHPNKGWENCQVLSSPIEPIFGAAAWCVYDDEQNTSPGTFHGILCGGLTSSGLPNSEAFRWQFKIKDSQPTITFEPLQMSNEALESLSLFGSSVIMTTNEVLLCGGVGTSPQSTFIGQSIVRLPRRIGCMKPLSSALLAEAAVLEHLLLIGSSIVLHQNHLLVVGGGAPAYPSGHVWADSVHTITLNLDVSEASRNFSPRIELLESPKITSGSADLIGESALMSTTTPLTSIPRAKFRTTEDFRTVLMNRKPVIIQGLDFGACLTRWTPQYLASQIGRETQVIVHESVSDSPRLDFNAKNFKYVTESFGKVIEKMQEGGRMYLRSLSRLKPSDIPANLDDDFPSLAKDFQLPHELDFAKDSLFSSILRLSGRANMWLHYDVSPTYYKMDLIRGTKRMILFPPRDATRLGFAPGASSSSFDVFSALGTQALAGTQPHEAILGEGDALFLPAAWLHTAAPLTDMSVAVNVFFRDLDSGYADGRDVYGNRDLAAYEKGRQDVVRIARTFRNVPQDMRQFYLSRIAAELLQLAENP